MEQLCELSRNGHLLLTGVHNNIFQRNSCVNSQEIACLDAGQRWDVLFQLASLPGNAELSANKSTAIILLIKHLNKAIYAVESLLIGLSQ